jgi:hypothetical protein
VIDPGANAVQPTEGESGGGGIFAGHGAPTKGHGASIRRGGCSGHSVVVGDFFHLPVGVQLTGMWDGLVAPWAARAHYRGLYKTVYSILRSVQHFVFLFNSKRKRQYNFFSPHEKIYYNII